MFCTKCGKELVDNAAFCTECGEKFNTNENPQSFIPQIQNVFENASANINDGLKGNKKMFIIAGIAIAVVILISVIAIAAVNSGGAGYTIVGKMYTEPLIDDTGLHVFYGSKQLTAETDDDNYRDYYFNASHTAEAIFTYEGELYFAHNGKLDFVTEDKDLQNYCQISDDGSSLLYIIDDELFIYKNGKSVSISSDAESFSSAVISPNGSAVAYAVRNKDYEYECYAYNGKKTVKIGKYYPISISDNGSVLYAVKSKNNKLCIIKNLDDSTEESIESYDSYYSYTYLSENHKSILFSYGNTTYLYNPSFDKAMKVSKNKTLAVVFPDNSTKRLGSFDDFIGYSDGVVYRYKRNGKEFESYKIASTYNYTLSADGKKLVYTDDDKLYQISTTKEGAEKVKLGKDVSYMCGASSDLKHIYFISDDELCYSNGRENASVAIFDDVESGSAIVTPAGVCVFTVDDDDENTLYYSDKGRDAKEIKDIDDVVDEAQSGNIILIASDDDELYISENGRKFEKTNIDLDRY